MSPEPIWIFIGFVVGYLSCLGKYAYELLQAWKNIQEAHQQLRLARIQKAEFLLSQAGIPKTTSITMTYYGEPKP